jgi:hypothetical protein
MKRRLRMDQFAGAGHRFRDASGKSHPQACHTRGQKKPGGFTSPGFVVDRLIT